MTMPLQVISASQIQQRKAMVVPKSGGRDTSQTGLPPVPPSPGEAASRSSLPSRMSKPPPPPPPRGSASGIHAPPSATSMPMRIIPDGASSFAGGGDGQQDAAGVAAAGHSGAAIAPVPSVPILAPVSPVDPALSSGLGLPRLDQPVPAAIKPAAMAAANLQPMHGMPPAMSGAGQSNQSAAVIQPVGLASQTITTPPARANRASVIIAIVLGVLIGVIAVLLMQLLVLSH